MKISQLCVSGMVPNKCGKANNLSQGSHSIPSPVRRCNTMKQDSTKGTCGLKVVSMKLAEWNTKPENQRSCYEINAPSGAYIKFRNCIMHMVFKGTARQNTVKCRSSSMPHQGIYDRQHYNCTLTMASLMASTINVHSPWFCTLTTP